MKDREPKLISVMIPAFDAAGTLGVQLGALAGQSYRGPWEVIVSDNGSTDGTVDVARSFADRVPDLRVVDASDRRGPSWARNVAAKAARGDLLVFCDADDEVEPGWLSALARGARGADLVGGSYDRATLSAGSVRHRRNERTQTDLPTLMGFLPFSSSGNCAVWHEVFDRLGGWSERYDYDEDVEFMWRAQIAGYSLSFAPDAVVRKRSRASLADLAKQASRYGTSHVQLYRDFRRHGLARPSIGTAVRQWAWLVWHLPYLWNTQEQGDWVWIAGTRWGRLRGSVRYRVWCP